MESITKKDVDIVKKSDIIKIMNNSH